MKKLQILLFCILLAGLIASPCPGEEGSKFEVDGRTWGRWNESLKLGWVMGFGDGILQASQETTFLVIDIAGGMQIAYGVPFKEKGRKWADETLDKFE